MTARTRRALGVGIIVALVGAISAAVIRWLPDDKDLAARLVPEIEERLGVEVSIGSVRCSLLPAPTVVIEDFRTRQAEPVVIRRLTARVGIDSLWKGKLVLASVAIRDAVLPSDSVHAFRHKESLASEHPPPDHFEFHNAIWDSGQGMRLAYDGEADFDSDWRPHRAELRRPGINPPFVLAVERQGSEDRWRARIDVGSGTMNGDFELKVEADESMRLNGTLAPRGVEVADMMRAFERHPFVSGRGSGHTLVWAEGTTPGELLRTLHTRTTFEIRPATVLRFDLDKAINTLGKDHAGETPVTELTGQLDTQNTGHGIRSKYSGIRAHSGPYSATGEASTYRGKIEARGTLYLQSGGEVPFTVSGPVKKPKISVSRPAAAAAIVGKKAGDLADKIVATFRSLFAPED